MNPLLQAAEGWLIVEQDQFPGFDAVNMDTSIRHRARREE